MHDSKLEIILEAKDMASKAFDSVKSNVSSLASSISSLAITMAAAAGAGGFGAFVSIVEDGVESLAEWDKKLLRTEALIKSTRNAAGLQVTELSDFAKQLDLQTLGDRDEILAAINAMQTFRSVSQDTFKRAIVLGQDLAEVLGGDIKSQAIQLGKALEDPVKGITALSRSGVSFTQVQKDQIKVLVESGQKLEAQSRILDEIEKQVGGAAAGAAGGLSGKMDTLSFRWREFKEAMATSVGGSKIAAAGIDTLSRSLEHMSSVLSPDVQTMMTMEIEGLQSRLKIFQRLGTDGSSKIIADVQSRIETLKSGLEELRNPTGDLSIDYGNLNDNIAAGQIIQENAAKAAKEAAKAAEELQAQIRELDQVVKASNANPWDPIGYDIDMGGIDEVSAAIQKTLLERNNRRLETFRNIAAQQGIEDTYDIDMGDPMAGLADDAEKAAERMKQAFTGWGNSFSATLADAVVDSSASFDEILKSFEKMAVQMVIQEKVVEPIFGEIFKHADGGVYNSPSLASYEGTVTNKPHFFTFARGGVFGEAGWEGILPLKTMTNGELGVRATGAAPNVEINIIDNAGVRVTQKKKQTQQGLQIDVLIDQIQAGNTSRRGSYTNRALRNVYGAREQLVAR